MTQCTPGFPAINRNDYDDDETGFETSTTQCTPGFPAIGRNDYNKKTGFGTSTVITRNDYNYNNDQTGCVT